MTEHAQNYLVDGPEQAPVTFIFAHGAGLPMDAPFMETITRHLGKAGLRVVRFEFDYMARRRAEGRNFPPDPPDRLLGRFRAVAADFAGKRLALGGKSLGGRIASMIAAEGADDVAGLVCFGYPFHPPGRPENLRTAHLGEVRVPALICQGERDPFGTREELAAIPLPPNFAFHWLPDGGHGFKPRAASGVTEEQNLQSAAGAAAQFIKQLAEKR